MAAVRLADVIVPEVYATYQAENNPEKTEFYQSGIVVRNTLLDQKARSGGEEITVPFWKDIDPTKEPNVSSDDPDVKSTPSKIGASKFRARIAYVNESWSSMDLASQLAGSSPMMHIAARTGAYWNRQWQRRLIASSVGIMAENIANNNSDMVYNPATPTAFSRNGFIDAVYTMGDALGAINAAAVHSVVAKQMAKNDDVETIRDSEGNIVMLAYQGKRLFVDDGLPTVDGKILSVLYGNGAFGYGEGLAEVPVETKRDPDAGNGGGQDTLYERKTWMLHPFGFDFTSASVAKQSATLTELQSAENWERVVARKNIPMAFMLTTL